MARRGEEAVREEAARKGPAVEAAVAAVKGARAEREGGAVGEEAANGGFGLQPAARTEGISPCRRGGGRRGGGGGGGDGGGSGDGGGNKEGSG